MATKTAESTVEDDESDLPDIDALIEQAFGDDEPDEGGLGSSAEDADPPSERITVEEGADRAGRAIEERERADKGDLPKRKAKAEKTQPVSAETEDDQDAEDDAKSEDTKAAKEAADLTTARADDLLEGMPEDKQSEVMRRLNESAQVTKIFDTPEIKAELAMHGADVPQAIGRLVQLNAFAQAKPDEYVAWVVSEVAGKEKALEVFGKAAGLLGLQVVDPKANSADDDDLFESEDVKALKARNAELEARLAQQAPTFGPDTPERQQQRNFSDQLMSFVAEKDPATGRPIRQFWDVVQPIVIARATDEVSRTGKFVTLDRLGQIYDDAVATLQQSFTGPDSAAHAEPGVATGNDESAAAAEKAKRASKSLDGTGQGAGRRPALPENAPLSEVIKTYLDAAQNS